MADQLYPLTIDGIRRTEQHETLLVLSDDRERTIRLAIGLCEASAIQSALDGAPSPRPMTHDLALTLAIRLEAPVSRVIIDDVSGGTYYARLLLAGPEGPISLDCRPSDAIAIALRARAPIFASDAVMNADTRE